MMALQHLTSCIVSFDSGQFSALLHWSFAGKHDVKKDRKTYSKELREKRDAKSSAMTLQVTLAYWLYATSMMRRQLEGKYSLESTDPHESEILAHLRP